MTYVHHLPGRLRVRTPGVKQESVRNALRGWLNSTELVQRFEVNALTGSVLIYYDHRKTSGERLLATIRDRGWIGVPEPRPKRQTAPTPAAPQRYIAPVEWSLAAVLLRYMAEFAIERCLVALAAAVL